MSDDFAVRLAMRGWRGSQAAETADEVQIGLKLPWVEVEGHRLENVQSATVEATTDGFCLVTIAVIGRPEIVYVDKDGDELPGAHRQPEELPGSFDRDTVIGVGGEA